MTTTEVDNSWRSRCHIDLCNDGGYTVHSPTHAFWLTNDAESWKEYFPEEDYESKIRTGNFRDFESALRALASCTIAPLDASEPAPPPTPVPAAFSSVLPLLSRCMMVSDILQMLIPYINELQATKSEIERNGGISAYVEFARQLVDEVERQERGLS